MISTLMLLALTSAAPASQHAAKALGWTTAAQRVPAVASALGYARLGQWVTYRIDGGQIAPGYLRIAVVGEEESGLWLEIDTGQHPELAAPLMQLRLLVDRKTGLRRGGVRRMLVAVGTDKPAEVEQEALAEVFAAESEPRPDGRRPSETRTREGRPSRVQTRAGSVAASPIELIYRSTVVQRFWVSDEVPLLKLVKIELPALRQSFELHAHGDGAKPRMILPGPNSPRIQLDSTKDTP